MTVSEITAHVRQSFERARVARSQGNLQEALEGWNDVIARTEGAADSELRQARMAAASEAALAYQELGDGQRAHDLLQESVAQAEILTTEPVEGEHAEQERLTRWMALAGVRTNLASLLVSARMPKEGIEVANASLEAIENAEGHPAGNLLRFAALMQRGSGQLLLGNAKEGAADLRKGVDYGVIMAEAGQQQVLPQLVEAVGRLYVGAKAVGDAPATLEVVERVARLAEAAFEAGGAPLVNVFVAAQMHRVNALIDLGRFAPAEDELWRAIDGSGQGNLLVSAPDFYATLWQRDDEALESGDLPRNEVKDAWLDTIEQAKNRGTDALALEVMRARYAMYVDGASGGAKAIVEANQGADAAISPLSAALLKNLANEIAQRGDVPIQK